MKKVKTILATLLLLAGVTPVITSCSDDNKEPESPAAQSVAGSYTDMMTCTVAGSESEFENLTFTLTPTDDYTVTVVTPSFGNPPMKMPQITVSGVKVTGTDGSYTLAPTEFNGTTDSGKAYSGTLRGSFENNTLKIDFQLNYGAMPMPLICSFESKKL